MHNSVANEQYSTKIDRGSFKKYLSSWTSELGIRVESDKFDLLLDDLLLVLEKNIVVNLTSIRDPYDALILHTLDSLAFLRPLDTHLSRFVKSIRLLDMGSGGGFPGIPLACSRDYEIVLLDSVGKKAAACDEFVHELGIEKRVTAVHSRLEDYARTSFGSFDCVVARALSSLDVLLEYASPFLKMGGYLICGKGKPDDNEIAKSELVEGLCGFSRVSRETFELPDEYGHREFFVYKKTWNPQIKLPRKNGEAKNNPLADSKRVSRETSKR